MPERSDLQAFADALHLPPEEIAAALAVQRRALPWYAEAVAAIGGWVAALMLTAAIAAMAGMAGNAAGLGFVGALLTGGGLFGMRRSAGPFGHQFSLALILAGQCLVVAAVGVGSESVPATAVAAVLLAVVLVPLVPDRIHQFLTVAAAVVMVLAALLIEQVSLAVPIVALVSVPAGVALLLHPTRPLDSRPTAFVLLLAAPLCDGVATLLADWGLAVATGWGGRLAYLIGLAWPLLLLWPRAERRGRLLILGVAAAAVAAALLLPAGLAAGLLFMVLAYAIGSRLLAGLGVALEIFFMVRFYYDLRLDLLAKSMMLAAIGAVLFGLWLAWRRLAAEARP